MLPRAALRRHLRNVPTFRTLPKSELDAVAASVFCKEYRAGDRLWRAGVHLDFIGIVQQGEIVVEYRSNGSMKYASLLTGDFLQPSDLRDTRHLSSVSVNGCDVMCFATGATGSSTVKLFDFGC
jgi:signal-transduction protein with cAMP-binding, CBS, and nucleotidyltransferase domain